MINKSYFIGFLILFLSIVTGCGTPTSVKESATQSISLISELDKQLNAFRAAEARSEQYLLDKTKKVKQETSEYNQFLAVDIAAAKASKNTSSIEINQRLKNLIAELDLADQVYGNSIIQIESDMAKLLTTLPSSSKSLTATQSALAPLTTELSNKDKAKEATALITIVQEAIRENEAMIDQSNK